MGWGWHKPARRATERNEEAIARHMSEESSEIKKLARRQVWIAFEDESGASLTPVGPRTWAPRGKTQQLVLILGPRPSEVDPRGFERPIF